MKQALAALTVAFVALALSARLALAHRYDQPAYTAGQVQAGMLQHPDRWLGRTILVRGVVASDGVLYPSAAGAGATRRYAIAVPSAMQPIAWSAQATPNDLAQAVTPDPRAPLIVDQSGTDRGWFGALLRRVPLLNRLWPQRADGRHLATFRVALIDASAQPGCAARVCYHAALQDPTPVL